MNLYLETSTIGTSINEGESYASPNIDMFIRGAMRLIYIVYIDGPSRLVPSGQLVLGLFLLEQLHRS